MVMGRDTRISSQKKKEKKTLSREHENDPTSRHRGCVE